MKRRYFLKTAAAAGLGFVACARRAGLEVQAWVNDVHSGLNRTRVRRIVRVESRQQVVDTLASDLRRGTPVRASMRQILDEIQSGAFANEWLAQAREGAPVLHEQRAANRGHQVELVGKELRNLMPFLDPKTAPQ